MKPPRHSVPRSRIFRLRGQLSAFFARPGADFAWHTSCFHAFFSCQRNPFRHGYCIAHSFRGMILASGNNCAAHSARKDHANAEPSARESFTMPHAFFACTKWCTPFVKTCKDPPKSMHLKAHSVHLLVHPLCTIWGRACEMLYPWVFRINDLQPKAPWHGPCNTLPRQ